ncbi:MAG: NTP transferase domain-containing protein [Myxococcales bacterium]|nr:NTP transferase domain-containing protein [Myxococcales bacterium]MCB9521575.1 NTP transferase domain-containing protein [Myxococcales bacterium]MCB9530571.1 NTP transferase domain-containing protein [Myxococcales bacterium]MCB9534480.1 NTP transferase domain-containing protein [Myxococcales bacterium]
MIPIEFGIVLCAGLGVRLRPLTDREPKPALRFVDRPIADFALDALRAQGVSMIGVNAHHLPDRVDAVLRAAEQRWSASSGPSPRTTLVREAELLGTGGGARGIFDQLGAPRGTLCVINGDVVADFPLEAMLKVHRRTGATATLLVLPHLPGEAAIWLDADGRFVAQLPAPDGDWVSSRYAPANPATFGGVYLLETDVFERLTATNSCLIRNGIGPLLAEGAVVAAHRHEGFWADLGTPRRFLDATVRVLTDPDLLSSAPIPARTDGVFVADRRSVAADARLVGPCCVAPGGVVERGAEVGPAVVVGAGCVVRAGARVAETILMDGAEATGDVSRRIICGDVSARIA